MAVSDHLANRRPNVLLFSLFGVCASNRCPAQRHLADSRISIFKIYSRHRSSSSSTATTQPLGFLDMPSLRLHLGLIIALGTIDNVYVYRLGHEWMISTDTLDYQSTTTNLALIDLGVREVHLRVRLLKLFDHFELLAFIRCWLAHLLYMSAVSAGQNMAL